MVTAADFEANFLYRILTMAAWTGCQRVSQRPSQQLAPPANPRSMLCLVVVSPRCLIHCRLLHFVNGARQGTNEPYTY